MDIQHIKKERERWVRAKAEAQRQFNEIVQFVDSKVHACDLMLEVSSAQVPSFDTSFLSDPSQLPEPTTRIVEKPVPQVESPSSNVTAVEDNEEPVEALSDDETASKSTPDVERGRGGKPKLTDSMRYVLDLYGQLHPTEIAEKITEHGLAPNSKKLLDYIRYTLSKNKAMFAKVSGQRGMWQAVKVKGAAPLPKAEAPAPVAVTPEKEDDDGLEEKPVEIQKVAAFRERERTGTIRLTPEAAKALVDDMTDPRKRQKPALAPSTHT